MGYHGTRRRGDRPATIEGAVVAVTPTAAPRLASIGRWSYLWAWLKARREVRRAEQHAAMRAAEWRGVAARGYAGRHEPQRRVLSVTVRLDRARRSDVRRPVTVAVQRAPREKTPARHTCPGRAARTRVAAHRHRADTDSTLTVADVLAAIERGVGCVRA
jgi:hypothetical protein